jgi:hypothetical protein
VPIELIYENNSMRWGFQIKEQEQRHQWLKLSLDPESVLVESELIRKYADNKALPPAYAGSPEKMCTDFLKALRQHTHDIIRHKLSSSIVETTSFAFIVTVSIIQTVSPLKHVAKACHNQIGLKTRRDNVQKRLAWATVSSSLQSPRPLPSMHSTWCILMVSRSDRLPLSQTVAEALSASILLDSGYLDCSDMVIDLITYEIVELKPILKVREATAGKGGVVAARFWIATSRSILRIDSGLHVAGMKKSSKKPWTSSRR